MKKKSEEIYTYGNSGNQYQVPSEKVIHAYEEYRKKHKDDSINAPSHYFFGNYQVRDVLQAWLKDCGLSPDEASDWEKMTEYIFRYHKKGQPLADLKKARKYLDWIIGRYDD